VFKAGVNAQKPLAEKMSAMAILREPFEYLTELQRYSAAVVARPGEARLDGCASSPAILPDAVSLG
jgi:hypothetical protein